MAASTSRRARSRRGGTLTPSSRTYAPTSSAALGSTPTPRRSRWRSTRGAGSTSARSSARVLKRYQHATEERNKAIAEALSQLRRCCAGHRPKFESYLASSLDSPQTSQRNDPASTTWPGPAVPERGPPRRTRRAAASRAHRRNPSRAPRPRTRRAVAAGSSSQAPVFDCPGRPGAAAVARGPGTPAVGQDRELSRNRRSNANPVVPRPPRGERQRCRCPSRGPVAPGRNARSRRCSQTAIEYSASRRSRSRRRRPTRGSADRGEPVCTGT